jgi:hypothetical integral membrane protein (TIGR02206 family)
VPFGVAHLSALATVGLASFALTALVRRHPAASGPTRRALALLIVLLVAFEAAMAIREGWFDWRVFVPFELCDAALVLAVVALLSPRRVLAEVLYFWTASGSVLAMLTPIVPWSFPRWEFVLFFSLHGLVLAAGLVLVFGVGLRPRPGAPSRVFVLTLAWTGLVALANLALDANYMFLRRKPVVPTLLDWMGPWPVYPVTAAAVAYLLFGLLGLPFRREWRAGSEG